MRKGDKGADEHWNKTNQGGLQSPTSMKMKSTFLLQNTNPSFDQYAQMMRDRRRKTIAINKDAFGDNQQFDPLGLTKQPTLSPLKRRDQDDDREGTLFINKKNPSARDGHSAAIFDKKLIIFGGDRHHMPFNDLFMLDIEDFFFSGSAADENKYAA